MKPEGARGPVKTIHREHLLPIGQLVRVPGSDDDEPPQLSKRQPRTRQETAQVPESDQHSDSDSSLEFEVSRANQPYQTELDRLLQRPQYPLRTVSTPEPDSEPDVNNDAVLEESEVGDNPTGADSPASSESRPDSEDEISDIAEENEAQSRTDPVEKRRIKPVIRLTYDKLGGARDQPITIVHRGIVITIECN